MGINDEGTCAQNKHNYEARFVDEVVNGHGRHGGVTIEAIKKKYLGEICTKCGDHRKAEDIWDEEEKWF